MAIEAATDEMGYLLDLADWSEQWAIQMAEADAVALSDEHWEIIRFVQDYYREYDVEPPMRVLVRALSRKLGPDKGSSRHLYRLFPQGPAKQVCRYAGLRKPVSCI